MTAKKYASKKLRRKMINKTLEELTSGECALIYRPLLNSPLGVHYGFLVVVSGVFKVFHLSKVPGAEKIVNLDDFAAGKKVGIEQVGTLDPLILNERASFAFKNYSTYSVTGNNCEDFARFLFCGKWVSYQVLIVIGLIIGVGFLALSGRK